jgi:cell division transport system ATP-binding protein
MINIFNATIEYDNSNGIYNINLVVEKGEFIYLTGPSGAGKSTLIRMIYFDLMPQRGHIIVDRFNSTKIKKKEIPILRRRLGIVFQEFRLFDDRTVFENVQFVLEVTGWKRREMKRRVLQVLADVGIAHKRNAMPNELSGGEKQRVAIARALVNEPYVLLADEPTGNLDPQVSNEIMELLQKVNRRGTAVIMATHDYNLIEKFPARQVRIEKGRIV